MKEILTVNVKIEDTVTIKGNVQNISFVRFSGNSESEYFKGIILPSAVDIQIFSNGKKTLSARYVLEGVDYTGENCRIFIENTSSTESRHTTPKIITDSKALSWLEAAELVGKIETVNRERIIIHIFYNG